MIEQCRNNWLLFNICQCNRGIFKIKQKIKHQQYTCNIKYFVYLNYTVTLSFSSVICKTQKEQKFFPSFTLKTNFVVENRYLLGQAIKVGTFLSRNV